MSTGVKVEQVRGAFLWTAGMAVNADGAPNAYAPEGSGLHPLDVLANAGHPGHYYGVVMNAAGLPVVQGPTDPFPGYCVSTTALVDHRFGERDPRRYVDARLVPFAVVPPDLISRGVRMGDLAVAIRGDVVAGAVVGDEGPGGHFGEGSIRLADDLKIPGAGTVRHRGVESGVTFLIFPGSHATPAWPREVEELRAAALARFEAWGGSAALIR
jgi:Fungal chitosanase of glycosyl hydrolase group 75